MRPTTIYSAVLVALLLITTLSSPASLHEVQAQNTLASMALSGMSATTTRATGQRIASDARDLLSEQAILAATGETTRVSVATDSDQGNGVSVDPSVSDDGRYVVFTSLANNLVVGDTNICEWNLPSHQCLDVFVHDRQTGETTRVSVATSGTQGNSDSSSPAISADGRYVAFMSFANNLVVGDTNICESNLPSHQCPDVFVHDRQTGETTRISVATDGTQGNRDSYSAALSADGRYVVFESAASNLVSGDTNGQNDVFVHDRETGETERVSVATNGVQGNSGSGTPALSADGRYVAFLSYANNLVVGDTNICFLDVISCGDIFVHDRETGETERVSVATNGVQGNGDAFGAAISADGRYVAFRSRASNLVGGDTNGLDDIFVHDRQIGQTMRVSVATGGTQGNSGSGTPAISADGRYVAFLSYANNLVVGDTNELDDIFVHDRQTGQTTRVSVATDGGQGNNYSGLPAISADGRYVAFHSAASTLVSSDTNGFPDVFVHDRGEGGGGTDCARFVSDVNYPDGSVVAPGQVFEKRWRLQNCGTSSWSGYQAVRTSGTYGPVSFPVSGAAGGPASVAAMFTAPASPGTYRATYKMQGPSGQFGDAFWAEVVVGSSGGSGNPQRPLIVIPGIMGSRLYNTRDNVETWPTEVLYGSDAEKALAISQLAKIPGFETPFVATYTVGNPTYPYDSLHAMLTSSGGYREHLPDITHTPLERCEMDKAAGKTDITLFVFAYDWRQTNDASAIDLGELIACVTELTGQDKVDILAHSMGGLIARKYIAGFTSQGHHVETLVSIGTPWLGSPKTIYGLETGDIADPDSKESWLKLGLKLQALKLIAGASPSVAQLLPSESYYLLGGRPFKEAGWDINNNGNAHDSYESHDNLMALIEQRYSIDATLNRFFHAGRQDDWRQTAHQGVRYFHIIGFQEWGQTIKQVRATETCLNKKGALGQSICLNTSRGFDVELAEGDGTVPILSAQRIGNGLNLNDLTATLWVVRERAGYGSADHTGMTANSIVQACIITAFQGRGNCTLQASPQGAGVTPAGPSLPDSVPAHYLEIVGSAHVTVADTYGATTDTISGTLGVPVPDVTLYHLGEVASLFILPTYQTYTATVRAGASSLIVNHRVGTGDTATQATRYLDVDVPPGTLLQLRITPQGIEPLRADTDGNGSFETEIAPTASVSGIAANDLDAPAVTISAAGPLDAKTVTIAASDGGSGVKQLLYSLDGTTFQPYTAPFAVDATQTQVVYAFADDNVANRSSLLAQRIVWMTHLPLTVR